MTDLPQSFLDLIELLGEEDAYRLVKLWGGARRYVPRDVPEDHALTEAFGASKAQEIADKLGSGHVVIPNLTVSLRKRAVVKYRDQGYTAPQIADLVGITDQRVWQILREHKGSGDDDQLRMFG